MYLESKNPYKYLKTASLSSYKFLNENVFANSALYNTK